MEAMSEFLKSDKDLFASDVDGSLWAAVADSESSEPRSNPSDPQQQHPQQQQQQPSHNGQSEPAPLLMMQRRFEAYATANKQQQPEQEQSDHQQQQQQLSAGMKATAPAGAQPRGPAGTNPLGTVGMHTPVSPISANELIRAAGAAMGIATSATVSASDHGKPPTLAMAYMPAPSLPGPAETGVQQQAPDTPSKKKQAAAKKTTDAAAGQKAGGIKNARQQDQSPSSLAVPQITTRHRLLLPNSMAPSGMASQPAMAQQSGQPGLSLDQHDHRHIHQSMPQQQPPQPIHQGLAGLLRSPPISPERPVTAEAAASMMQFQHHPSQHPHHQLQSHQDPSQLGHDQQQQQQQQMSAADQYQHQLYLQQHYLQSADLQSPHGYHPALPQFDPHAGIANMALSPIAAMANPQLGSGLSMLHTQQPMFSPTAPPTGNEATRSLLNLPSANASDLQPQHLLMPANQQPHPHQQHQHAGLMFASSHHASQASPDLHNMAASPTGIVTHLAPQDQPMSAFSPTVHSHPLPHLATLLNTAGGSSLPASAIPTSAIPSALAAAAASAYMTNINLGNLFYFSPTQPQASSPPPATAGTTSADLHHNQGGHAHQHAAFELLTSPHMHTSPHQASVPQPELASSPYLDDPMAAGGLGPLLSAGLGIHGIPTFQHNLQVAGAPYGQHRPSDQSGPLLPQVAGAELAQQQQQQNEQTGGNTLPDAKRIQALRKGRKVLTPKILTPKSRKRTAGSAHKSVSPGGAIHPAVSRLAGEHINGAPTAGSGSTLSSVVNSGVSELTDGVATGISGLGISSGPAGEGSQPAADSQTDGAPPPVTQQTLPPHAETENAAGGDHGDTDGGSDSDADADADGHDKEDALRRSPGKPGSTRQPAVGKQTPNGLMYPCKDPNCDKLFASRLKLRSHMKSHNPRNYHCYECDASFKRSHDLRRHQRSLHTVLKPFHCHKCNKTFARLDALKRHTVRAISPCYDPHAAAIALAAIGVTPGSADDAGHDLQAQAAAAGAALQGVPGAGRADVGMDGTPFPLVVHPFYQHAAHVPYGYETAGFDEHGRMVLAGPSDAMGQPQSQPQPQQQQHAYADLQGYAYGYMHGHDMVQQGVAYPVMLQHPLAHQQQQQQQQQQRQHEQYHHGGLEHDAGLMHPQGH
ncbi:hypothetical protein BC831DRAFT_476198 [Entophlyctis helioformis]|nr:hypothetical protein BC831DRAFT_476198 [Entophlyctis helioformis]